ncbi:hypothetical protein Tco_0529684 [Tanacetum coccineum]
MLAAVRRYGEVGRDSMAFGEVERTESVGCVGDVCRRVESRQLDTSSSRWLYGIVLAMIGLEEVSSLCNLDDIVSSTIGSEMIYQLRSWTYYYDLSVLTDESDRAILVGVEYMNDSIGGWGTQSVRGSGDILSVVLCIGGDEIEYTGGDCGVVYGGRDCKVRSDNGRRVVDLGHESYYNIWYNLSYAEGCGEECMDHSDLNCGISLTCGDFVVLGWQDHEGEMCVVSGEGCGGRRAQRGMIGLKVDRIGQRSETVRRKVYWLKGDRAVGYSLYDCGGRERGEWFRVKLINLYVGVKGVDRERANNRTSGITHTLYCLRNAGIEGRYVCVMLGESIEGMRTGVWTQCMTHGESSHTLWDVDLLFLVGYGQTGDSISRVEVESGWEWGHGWKLRMVGLDRTCEGYSGGIEKGHWYSQRGGVEYSHVIGEYRCVDLWVMRIDDG